MILAMEMGVTQWVLLGFIVLLLIAYPILMSRRNKSQNQKMEEQANSLKRGDEVITNAGIYGKVLEVKQDGNAKKVVIETGSDKNKSYLTVDAYCVYSVLGKETKEPAKKEDKQDDKKEEKQVEEKKTEIKAEKAEKTNPQVKADKKTQAKTAPKKSSTKKK